jgi:hypothetical protein
VSARKASADRKTQSINPSTPCMHNRAAIVTALGGLVLLYQAGQVKRSRLPSPPALSNAQKVVHIELQAVKAWYAWFLLLASGILLVYRGLLGGRVVSGVWVGTGMHVMRDVVGPLVDRALHVFHQSLYSSSRRWACSSTRSTRMGGRSTRCVALGPGQHSLPTKGTAVYRRCPHPTHCYSSWTWTA